jgi:membrane protease YdiL (CAAX protease family)
MLDTSENKPVFATAQWSVFGCAGVGCLSFALFAIVQLIAFFVVLFRVHPEAQHVFAGIFAGVPPPSKLLLAWTTDVSSAPNLFLFAAVGDGVMIVCALLLARWVLGAGLDKLGLAVKTSGGQLAFGFLAGLALVIVSQVVSAIQAKLFGPHTQAVAELLKTHHGLMNFFFDFAAVCIIAPFAEELLFRGVVFAGLVQRVPLWPAAILSGLIFGAAHLDPWSIVPLATIGVGLAFLYYRSGTLWPNVVAHATVNAVALVAVYVFPQFAT